jgi:serine/threonine-protein kinase
LINERYRIVAAVARGGMGKVYRAEQETLGRAVALKVLDPAHSGEDDPEFHQRFFLEASLTSKLTHPNTVTIFDYGKTEDDVYYIAMELLEGRTLHRALQDDGPFPPARTIHVAAQIARALREAHGLGVIHRDLKPANVFLVRHGDESDHAKVLDFGLVKNVHEKSDDQLTKTGVFLGSPKYMAPEQIRGETIDGRSDVYALGVLMFEMLTGKAPFDRPTSVNTLMAHLHEPVPALSQVYAAVQAHPVEHVVRRCLAKDPAERYPSMNDLLPALREAAGNSLSGNGELSVFETGAYAPPAHVRAVAAAAGSTPSRGSQPSSSFSTGAPPFAQASKGSGSMAPLFLAGLFALTGIGGFIVLSGQFQPAGNSAPSAATDQPTNLGATPLAAQEPSAPLPSRAVLVSLRSTPPGATVTVDGKEYGPTPTHAVFSGSAAELGREVVFLFKRRGFRDVVLTRTLDGTRLDIDSGRMEPATPRRSDTNTAPASAAPGGRPAASPARLQL